LKAISVLMSDVWVIVFEADHAGLDVSLSTPKDENGTSNAVTS
jgi:hypothetical protein